MYNTTKEQRRQVAIKDLRAIAAELHRRGDECSKEDSLDFTYLADCVQAKRYSHASQRARLLATCMRDKLPEITWEFLGIKPLPHYMPLYVEEMMSRCRQILACQ